MKNPNKRRSENEVEKLFREARKTNAERSRIELQSGFASPEDTDILGHLHTVTSAIKCGVACYDWNAVAEAHEMLIDAIKRIKSSQVKANKYIYTEAGLTKGN